MIKRIFFTLLALIAANLFSEFNPAISIGENIVFAGEQSYQIIDNNVYITFVQATASNYRVYFEHSEDYGQSFACTQIDTIEAAEFSKILPIQPPILKILPENRIIIFYTKHISQNNYSLFQAVSEDDGQTFSKELIEENIFSSPQTVISDTNLNLFYYSGLWENSQNFSFFEETDNSENADGEDILTPKKFSGEDVVVGKVHSNDDIWIQQAGGGNNNGWPTFLELVTTSGILRKYPGGAHLPDTGAPMDDIFRGGWQEHVPIKTIPAEATLIRENGIRPFDPNADIVYVKIDGENYQSMYGYIQFVGVDSFQVYSWYPSNAQEVIEVINNGGNWFVDADNIWTNYVPIYDTLWVEGAAGIIENQSVWVESELWIEGQIGGKQTWGCADTVYITSDITYENTTVGEAPDDENNPNLTDYFGLVSEKRIYIKYKHKDPFQNMILRDDNCNGVYLYGSYAAIGKGDEDIYGDLACHYDGIFSFEYQHPHGSTPDFVAPSPYTGNDTLYTFVDLHKFIFPIDLNLPPDLSGFNLHGNQPIGELPCGYPYESNAYLISYPNNGSNYVFPYGTDYPWYNPVWPEPASSIVFERGEIHLFGNIGQRRRGFIHRSGTDSYNHPEPSEWNLTDFHYDGTHPSTGYDKNYHYDTRLNSTDLLDFPYLQSFGEEHTLKISRSENEGDTFNETFSAETNRPLLCKSIAADENEVVVCYQTQPSLVNILYSENGGNSYQTYQTDFSDYSENLIARKIIIRNGNIYLFARDENLDVILSLNLAENFYQEISSFVSEQHLSDFSISPTGAKYYVNAENEIVHFVYTQNGTDFTGNYDWQPNFLNADYNPATSKIALNFNETDSLFVAFLRTPAEENVNSGNLFLARGHLELTAANEENISAPKFKLVNYPNPFQPRNEKSENGFRISFSLPQKSNVEISVFNLKGQLVKKITDEEYNSGEHFVFWNGKNENGKKSASGIYFYKFQSAQNVAVKKILLMK